MNAIEVRRNEETRLALGYVGIGCTGRISKLFGDKAYRSRRPDVHWLPESMRQTVNDKLADARDSLSILKLFARDRPFRYAEAGRTASAHEILCANLPRFAKIMRCDVDVEGGSMMTEFAADRFRSVLARRTVTEALRDGLRGEALRRRDIRLLSPTLVQYDGEAFEAPTDTEISLQDRPGSVPVIGLPLAA